MKPAMICETCHGTGFCPHTSPARPCEECGGTGWTHCCEGERPGNQTPASVHRAFWLSATAYRTPEH